MAFWTFLRKAKKTKPKKIITDISNVFTCTLKNTTQGFRFSTVLVFDISARVFPVEMKCFIRTSDILVSHSSNCCKKFLNPFSKFAVWLKFFSWTEEVLFHLKYKDTETIFLSTTLKGLCHR